ncbi:kinase-like domain-containing protein, partial [Mycena olivaceomarginata]
LPEELAVKEVVLLSEHPIKHGGFSNIYHGRYKNPDGEHQEVALKVLKIFEDQSDDRRNLLHDKFTKEALVWHYLRHKNIVKFIGVDSTTFPSPARAMVSPWMAQGSVLKYIAETSPVAPYAVELLDDVIKGLKYLHSVNIVHGDLCGRNILIDARGRACLTDFGLAAFVESDVTIKSSTRSGSVRWMAPELLSPPPGVSFRRTTASDLWAFGCVCGEIWTEGTTPFSHLSHEMGIIFAFSDPTNSPTEQPYQTRPSDKRGTLMPDRLWELAQWCWKYDASERPAVQVVADMLAEMRRQKNPNALLLEEEDDDAPPVASSSGPRHVGSETSSSANSVEYEAPPSSSHVSSADAVDDNLSSIVASAKGKQRVVHFEDESPAVVRFGPLLVTPDSDYEDAFFKIFEMLCELVSRRALVEPRSIHPYGGEYIDLHFRNELEANSFAMTWTVHRFEPYLECNAALIDAD